MESTRRLEFRYWTDRLTATALIEALQGYLSQERSGEAPSISTVSSVFFESADFRTYRSRQKAVSALDLIRLRWYGKLGESPVFLERKRKLGQTLRHKDRLSIGADEIKHLLEWPPSLAQEVCNLTSLDNVLYAEIRRAILAEALVPMLFIVYTRLAIQCGSTRATLDTHIEMDRIQDLDHFEVSESGYRFPYDVLEVKAEDGTPKWLAGIESHPAIVRKYTSFSKFSRGIELVFREHLAAANK